MLALKKLNGSCVFSLFYLFWFTLFKSNHILDSPGSSRPFQKCLRFCNVSQTSKEKVEEFYKFVTDSDKEKNSILLIVNSQKIKNREGQNVLQKIITHYLILLALFKGSIHVPTIYFPTMQSNIIKADIHQRYQITMMELFREIVEGCQALVIFLIKLHDGYLTGPYLWTQTWKLIGDKCWSFL